MKKYYLTTAIDYVNARPHLGTAYEKIGADCLARFKRMAGYDTYFLMGTDEHSTNVEKEAARLGKDPQEYCDEMAEEFKKVWAELLISYDQFVRTTDMSHVEAVKLIFRRIYENGYIYQGAYKGLYCVSCEEFLPEKELDRGKCPRHKVEPEWIEEKNYFFALSKFAGKLEEHILSHPEFIRPDIRRNEILNVVRSGLEDISISRVGKKWGVPVPVDEGQVVYVWFDALINYVSALGFSPRPSEKFKHYWPADCHIIGKDITRFHCLVWPAMLMAAGIELPRTVFGHGFINLKGEKMSKTMGNILDPLNVCSIFGPDALRYILLREIGFNRDGDFSIEQSVQRYNAELANELGNLLSRTLSMVRRYRGGKVPACDDGCRRELDKLAAGVREKYTEAMEKLAFDEALATLWTAVQAANRYVEEKRPWDVAKAPEQEELDRTLRVLLEVLRIASVLLFPFMPGKCAEMRVQLGLGGSADGLTIEEAACPGDPGWREVGEPRPLFPKIELPEGTG